MQSRADEATTRDIAKVFQIEHPPLYHVSTATAPVEGIYKGATRVGILHRHGNFGLGTFGNLDGEMVMVDGHCFQTRSDGSVRECDAGLLTPSALITRFAPDQTVTLARCPDLDHLYSRFDAMRSSANFFFGLKVHGHFDYVHTRAMCRTAEGVPSIQAGVVQPEFEFRNLSGTLVGFWTPEYAMMLNIPGYHLHFLSDDRRSGGHLLQCRGTNLRLQIQRQGSYHIALPEAEDFIDADLDRDLAAYLAEIVETK
jgi:acetolactate decarboxylase